MALATDKQFAANVMSAYRELIMKAPPSKVSGIRSLVYSKEDNGGNE